MKPYQQVPILECGEPLVAIPLDQFAVESPHAYVNLGAPYGDKSPYYLRQRVLEGLTYAQQLLQRQHPHWQIQVFDAYRPLAVQQYMVDYAYAQTVAAQGLQPTDLTPAQQAALLQQVYQFWAVPSYDPATPPPHSTGAAVDVTLVDDNGSPVEMGSAIDEMSPRSYPAYFRVLLGGSCPSEEAGEICDFSQQQPTVSRDHWICYDQNRQLLKQVMTQAGFRQHPKEWWHFSLGDQMWAWLMQQEGLDEVLVAQYGGVYSS
jgi:D-alanyl-D-alanine dipeptidase